MDRRFFLRSLAFPLAFTLKGCAAVSQPNQQTDTAPTLQGQQVLFVPGYRPPAHWVEQAQAKEQAHHCLLSRFDSSSSQHQLFPTQGHATHLSPDGQRGILCGFEAGPHLLYDTQNLAILAHSDPLDIGWRGGGHGVYFTRHSVVATTERCPRFIYRGEPATERYGRIALRDPHTLAVIEAYSCHGVDPHDICLSEDEAYFFVANYGSVPMRDSRQLGLPRQVVEASITVVDSQNGQLVERYVGQGDGVEIRHLAGRMPEQIFAIQTRMGQDTQETHHLDPTLRPGEIYHPAPPVMTQRPGHLAAMTVACDPGQMQQGLSIQVNPRWQQVLATYPSSHQILIFDLHSGHCIKQIDTRTFGLLFPCGLSLSADFSHFYVTGYQAGLASFSSQQLTLTGFDPIPLFGHSHHALLSNPAFSHAPGGQSCELSPV